MEEETYLVQAALGDLREQEPHLSEAGIRVLSMTEEPESPRPRPEEPYIRFALDINGRRHEGGYFAGNGVWNPPLPA